MKIQEQLTKLQNKLKAPKNQYNSFGKYKYRNAEDILEAVKPLLNEFGLTQIISDEIVQIGDRYYVKAIVTISNNEEQSLTVTAYARETESKKGMDEAQVTGATSSYARKYALNGMYAIDDTKDSDTEEFQARTKQTNARTAPIKKQIKTLETKLSNLFELADEKKKSALEMMALMNDKFGVTASTDLTEKQIDELISIISKE